MASKSSSGPDLTIDTHASKRKKRLGLAGVGVLGASTQFAQCAAAKLKSDELFLEWVSQKKTQDMILGYLDDLKRGRSLEVPVISPRSFMSPKARGSPVSPSRSASSPPPRSPISPSKRRRGFKELDGGDVLAADSSLGTEPVQRLRMEVSEDENDSVKGGIAAGIPGAPNRPVLTSADQIPRFFFKKKTGTSPKSTERHIKSIQKAFKPYRGAGVVLTEFVSIAKSLWGIPTFLCPLLFRRMLGIPAGAGADDSDEQPAVSVALAIKWYESEFKAFDHAERLFRLLSKPENDYIGFDDFMPMLEELLAYHPGLEFLEATPEFQEKYARTVITRIFYICSKAHNGKLTLPEVRRSNLIQTLTIVDEEEDINKVNDYFSYEHFYVIYCKFWELDTDHDFLLTREDLLRYGNHCLTRGIVDLIFDRCMRPLNPGPPDKMTYENFAYFFMSEVDKTNAISTRYWFRIVDTDDDGVIRPSEMVHLYIEQEERMESLSHEVVPFADVMCQMCDLLKPANVGKFVVGDFLQKQSMDQQGGVFFDMLFNLSEFLAYEQRDPFALGQLKKDDPDSTPWDRYAREEYARLAMEEEMRERGMLDDEFDEFEEGEDGDDMGGWKEDGDLNDLPSDEGMDLPSDSSC